MRFKSAHAFASSTFALILLLGCAADLHAQEVGKWRRHIIDLPNSSYGGNPFELEVDATFTHSATGTTLTLPGYYAGSNTWKVGFMPTELGAWSWITSSPDPDLDGVTGSVSAVPSGLPGMLKADRSNPRKWKFTNGPYAIPIAFRNEFFSDPVDIASFTAAADFMKDNNLNIMETRLTEEEGQFGGRFDFIFEGDWRDHKFDLAIWDRMDERMQIITERGLGAHIMFYSDDAGQPGWVGQSATEKLVIRYTIARLAGYPVVIFNSGIDIAEYRSQDDINWWGREIQSVDPYDHPISSRRGGGSGSSVFSIQTFDSRGDRLAIISDMTDYFQNSSVPVSMDDAWYENSPDGASRNKDFTEHDIRRAFWKLVAAGGLGGMIRGLDGFFHFHDFENDLESEQFLRHINPFIEMKLGATFGKMIPAPELVTGSQAYALADPGRNRILVVLLGSGDRYDTGGGGDVTVDLSGVTERLSATWFDPRTGTESSAGSLSSGRSHSLSPPDDDDWILLLTDSAVGTTAPEAITDLRAQ